MEYALEELFDLQMGKTPSRNNPEYSNKRTGYRYMCLVIQTNIGNRTIRVADIKQKYLANIVDGAKKCDYIDKVVMFGLANENT